MRGSRNFRRGGGGRLSSDKFFLFIFFVPQLGQFQRNLPFFKVQGGGVQLFPEEGGGVQLLIPCRDPYNL